MEAKDTVLKSSATSANIVHFPTIEEQAEVSFKAGILEVVEWIEQIYGRREYRGKYFDGGQLIGFNEISLNDWQAKLKEWEVKL